MSKNKINVGFNSSQNIKVPENCACINGLKVSTNKTQKIIDLTNNKAEYYAELAEEYKNEAKKFMEQSQYYAENNADITVGQFNALEDSLENYALKSELPVKVSELQNDSLYVKESEMESALNELDVFPPRENCVDMYLKTDGTDVYWDKISSGLEVGDIGIAPLGIDETKGLRRYLNGSVLDINYNTQEFVTKLQAAALLYPSLVCTESEWQSIASSSVGGQCGKFVINYDTDTSNAISIRLPKIIMPIQGLINMTKLGEVVEAGLPDITGGVDRIWATNTGTSTGCFGAKTISGSNKGGGGTANDYTISLKASLSNQIYGNSDTVQQEQIQYPYFIQIATGQETSVSIVNEIELNNPYTLFDSKYTEAPLYNTSWLQANSAYHSKSVYVMAYEALTVENNTSVEAGDSVTLPSGGTYVKRGLAVKLSADEDITDYDFVINTADETFRLPLKTKVAPSTESLPLYFYIGETVQNANLINAGRIAEQLSVKTNLEQAAAASMPGNKYIDLTLADSGAVYTAPAAGWICVQKGATNSGQYLEIINEVSKLGLRCYNAYTASNGQPMKVFLPVNKGDSFKVNYSASLATEYFRFVYPLGGED